MPGIDDQPQVAITNKKYQDVITDMMGASAEMPACPQDRDLEALTRRVWEQTERCYWHQDAVARWRADLDSLLPGRRHKREQLLAEQKDGTTLRVHDEALIYRNVETMVAMTVPDDHSVHYKPCEQVKQPDDRNTQLGEDPHARRFADTLRLVTKRYTDEINFQQQLEAFAQDATLFNMGILKVTWRVDYATSDPMEGAGRDMQDNAAFVDSVLRDQALGRLWDGRELLIKAMQHIQQAGGDTSEIELWSGLECRVVPRWSFRYDGNIRDITRIYRAAWMSDDVLLTRRAIKSRWPYEEVQRSESGEVTEWKGVHPSHLDGAAVYGEDYYGAPKALTTDELQHRRDEYDATRMTQDDELLLVRTVYHRADGVIYTLINGVNYPIDRVIPKKAPEQWYPYLVFSPNRMPEDPNGVSDVELQKHIVDRILRKNTDAEKARHNSLGRLFYSKNDLDHEDVETIENSKSGGVYGLNLKSGQKISDVVALLATPMSMEAFDDTRDLQNLRQMAVISEQTQGVTGRAKFAREVVAAQQGTAISASKRQDKYRRALDMAYKLVHELLLLYVPPDMAKRIAGPYALWPEILSDAEARQIMAGIKQTALQQALVQLMPTIASDLQQSAVAGAPIDPHAYMEPLQEAAEAIASQMLQERYGHNELLTRDMLYRSLKIDIAVSVNGLVDSSQRISNAIQLLEIAAASGTMVDGRPFVKEAAKQMRMDDDIAGSVSQDPNMLLQEAVRAAASNPQQVSEESLRTVMGLADMINSSMAMGDSTVPRGVADAAVAAGDRANMDRMQADREREAAAQAMTNKVG